MTRPSYSPLLHGLAWGMMLIAAPFATADEPQAAGVVRISKAPAGTVTIRGQSDSIELTGCKNCERGYAGDGHVHSHGGHVHSDDVYMSSNFQKGIGKGGYFCEDCQKWNHGFGCGCNDRRMLEYFKCKFGYFIPTGNGGAGTPPFGKYYRVYPQDPNYFDQRDGQAWGAAGYGTPISVPLAPVVGHQYNYSWGTPASRLTPVSRIAPY